MTIATFFTWCLVISIPLLIALLIISSILEKQKKKLKLNKWSDLPANLQTLEDTDSILVVLNIVAWIFTVVIGLVCLFGFVDTNQSRKDCGIFQKETGYETKWVKKDSFTNWCYVKYEDKWVDVDDVTLILNKK